MNSHIYSKHTPEFHALQQNIPTKLNISTKLVHDEHANADIAFEPEDIDIIIDAKSYACPMPLLKVKLALKSLTDHGIIYLIASDVNANHDIAKFCQKNHHTLIALNHQDTFFHFIIIKNTGV